MEDLKIIYLSPDELTPYENNTRKHAPEDIESIKKSILDTGFNDPIGIWGEQNLIVEGHGRQIAAKELHLDKVPCIRLDHLTDEQRREYAIRHNRSAELSTWDFEALEEELARLNLDGVDMDDLEFELQKGNDDDYQKKDDETPELKDDTTTQTGQLYQLGEHRLICGDSTDPNVLDFLLGGVKCSLMLTDPPYGINVVKPNGNIGDDKPIGVLMERGARKAGKNKILDCNEYAPVIGDDTTDTAKANYELAKAYSKKQIIFGGNYFTDFLPPSRCWLVWDKQNTGDFADAELAWTNIDHGVKLYRFMWNGLCRQGSREIEGKKRVHPTQKPVGMLSEILQDFSKEGDTILDCFGGSGSTLIACEQTGRKCFMVEMSPAYCDIIIQRWENLTGQKAVLLNA